jgi:aminopeptidase N
VARRGLMQALAARLEPLLPATERALRGSGAFSADAAAAGRRALRGMAVYLMSWRDGGATARAAFAEAPTMTESLQALTSLLAIGQGQEELTDFGSRWAGDRLVMDKWFALQIGQSAPDKTADLAVTLSRHPAFDLRNPNRARAVFGALSGHHAGFHHASGRGYQVLADALIALDAINPQTAARMSTAFETWARYDASRQALARAAMQRIADAPGLSRDLSEMIGRLLG